jgi:hypothetical protein
MRVQPEVAMDPVLARLNALERELARSRRRSRALAAVALVGAAAWLLGPSDSFADRAKREIHVSSQDGRQQAHLLPGGLVFEVDGQPRLKLEVGEAWDYVTAFGPTGAVRWTISTEESGTSMKIFSNDEKLRVEMADQLLDSGAGVRLYDRAGAPRASFYADKRGGESGVELTDANLQPRVDIYAEPNGVTVLRASTSNADASAELSILPESDAVARYTGAVPERAENDPFVPMLYMLDRTGLNTLVTPVSPR